MIQLGVSSVAVTGLVSTSSSQSLSHLSRSLQARLRLVTAVAAPFLGRHPHTSSWASLRARRSPWSAKHVQKCHRVSSPLVWRLPWHARGIGHGLPSITFPPLGKLSWPSHMPRFAALGTQARSRRQSAPVLLRPTQEVWACGADRCALLSIFLGWLPLTRFPRRTQSPPH